MASCRSEHHRGHDGVFQAAPIPCQMRGRSEPDRGHDHTVRLAGSRQAAG